MKRGAEPLKHLECWRKGERKRDVAYAKLAIPGLVVDKLLQFWLYRKEFLSSWLLDNRRGKGLPGGDEKSPQGILVRVGGL